MKKTEIIVTALLIILQHSVENVECGSHFRRYADQKPEAAAGESLATYLITQFLADNENYCAATCASSTTPCYSAYFSKNNQSCFHYSAPVDGGWALQLASGTTDDISFDLVPTASWASETAITDIGSSLSPQISALNEIITKPCQNPEALGVSGKASTATIASTTGAGPYRIGNDQLTASNADSQQPASRARLYTTSAWCVTNPTTSMWWQVSFNTFQWVHSFKVKGYDSKLAYTFKLQYSRDGFYFDDYKTMDGAVDIFQAGTQQADWDNVYELTLWKPVLAKFIRILPQTWDSTIYCLQFELYGCPATCYEPMGIEGYEFPDSSYDASAWWDTDWLPWFSQLNNYRHAWHAEQSSMNYGDTWLQIDLGKDNLVTGVIMQNCMARTPGWDNRSVDKFSVMYCNGDCSNGLNTYADDTGENVFLGIPNAPLQHYRTFVFENPIIARKVRLVFRSHTGPYPCGRWEIIGCKEIPSNFDIDLALEKIASGPAAERVEMSVASGKLTDKSKLDPAGKLSSCISIPADKTQQSYVTIDLGSSQSVSDIVIKPPRTISSLDPVGLWLLDFATGAQDLSGNGNDGSVSDVDLADGIHGQKYGSFSFKGAATSGVVVGNPNTADNDLHYPTSDFSIFVWIYTPASRSSEEEPLIHFTRPGGSCCAFIMWKFGMTIHINYKNLVSYNSDTALKADEWNFVGLVYERDIGYVTVFVNGHIAGTAFVETSAILETNTPVYFGRSWHSDNRQFLGRMACVQMYNRLLSREEMDDAKTCPWMVPNPMFFWSFDDITGANDAFGSVIDASVSAVVVQENGYVGVPASSYYFDGTSGAYVSYPNTGGNIDAPFGLTISFHMNRRSTQDAQTMVAYLDQATASVPTLSIAHFTGALRVFVTCLNIPSYNATFFQQFYRLYFTGQERFRQVALTYDYTTSKMTLYHEGQAVFQRQLPTGCQLATNGPLRVGGLPSSEYYTGRMGCLQIFDKPLTAREVIQVSRCPRKTRRAAFSYDLDEFSHLKDTTGNIPFSESFSPYLTTWGSGPWNHNTHEMTGASVHRLTTFGATNASLIQQLTNDFTLMVWVKLFSINTETHIISTASNTYSNIILGVSASNQWFLNFKCTSSGTVQSVSAGTVAANTWYHVAARRLGGALAIFVNGDEIVNNGGKSTCTLEATTSYNLLSNLQQQSYSTALGSVACFVGYQEALVPMWIQPIMQSCPGLANVETSSCFNSLTMDYNQFIRVSSYKPGTIPSRANIDDGANFWSPVTASTTEYVGIVTQQEYEIRLIGTRGHPTLSEWVTTYKVEHWGHDSVKFIPNWDGTGERIFKGNTNNNGNKYNRLYPSLRTKEIRLYPQTWNTYPTMRVNFIGCKIQACSYAIHHYQYYGVTTSHNDNVQYHHAIVENYEIWRYAYPAHLDLPYLQIALGAMYKVVKVSTKGGGSNVATSWVTKYHLGYSYNGKKWMKYKTTDGFVRFFTGNSEAYNAVKNALRPPVYLRYIRFYAEEWVNGIAMRYGIYGCKAEDEDRQFPALSVTLGDNAVSDVTSALSNPIVADSLNPAPLGDFSDIQLFTVQGQAKGRYLTIMTKNPNQRLEICQVSAHNNLDANNIAIKRGVVQESSAFAATAAATAKSATDGDITQVNADSAGHTCIVGYPNMLDEWIMSSGKSMITPSLLSSCTGVVAQWELPIQTLGYTSTNDLYLATWTQNGANTLEWIQDKTALVATPPPNFVGKMMVENDDLTGLEVAINKSLGYYSSANKPALVYMSDTYTGLSTQMFPTAADLPSTLASTSLHSSTISTEMASPGYVTMAETLDLAFLLKGHVAPKNVDAWIGIDLSVPAAVSHVVVYLPADRFGNSLANTEVRVGDDISTITNNKICDSIGDIVSDNRNPQRPYHYYCLRPIWGRYAILRRTTFGVLPVAEILVF